MKLLVDISGNFSGGCLQVALSFLYECAIINCKDIEYHVILGIVSQKKIDKKQFGNNFIFYEIPSHSIIKRNKYLRNIEKTINPDVAFSMFSPSYYFSDCIKVEGYAQAHYIYDKSPYWKICGIKEKLYYKLKKLVHLWIINKEADYLISETEDVTNRISKRFGANKRYFTVSNTCSSFFRNYIKDNHVSILPNRTDNEIRLLTLCSYHTHKNLIIIPDVLDMLIKKGYKEFRFIITIDDNNYNRIIPLRYRNYVINLGAVDMVDAPQLYSEIDFMFSPTLLECFSANYPEAMIMRRPILTSNLPFATSICKESALYFDPCNPEDIANKIIELSDNKFLQKKLIEKGEQVLNDFLTPTQRAEEYLRICKLAVKNRIENK